MPVANGERVRVKPPAQSPHQRFEEFYRSYHSVVFTLILRRIEDSEDAEDLTAEVFRVAWQHLQQGNDLSIGWVYGVAHNKLGNAYRSRTRKFALLDRLTEAHEPGEHRDEQLPDLDTRKLLARLPKRHSEILYMAYWDDLKTTEIAEVLGCSVAAVRVKLGRARNALKRLLPDEAQPDSEDPPSLTGPGSGAHMKPETDDEKGERRWTS